MTIFLMGSRSEGKIGFTNIFLRTQKSKSCQKMPYNSYRKLKKKRNSKSGVKTAQRPLFKELRAMLEKLDTLAYF